jgi:Zn-dependent peptidase ImmA (M78 family)
VRYILLISTEKLENITKKCRIITRFEPLDDCILGYYYSDKNYNIILLNQSIKNNERLYRCVLAEELGHYRITIGDITPRKYMCYKDRLTVDKQELLALRWATDFLIPSQMIIEALKTRAVNTFSELVDYFYVTKEFLMYKLEFMSKENSVWHIDSHRNLYLHKLPSVYIFDSLES